MASRPDSRSPINQLNIASMCVLLLIVLLIFFKDSYSFEIQKWAYLILGCMLIIVDALRIVAIIRSGHRRLLFIRVITFCMVLAVVGYWLWLHFI